MLLAALSVDWPLVALASAAAGAVAAVLKLRPERDALISEAAEHATQAISTVLAELRTQLDESRAEVDRLKDRELELLRRIESLEQAAQRELDELRGRERDLLARIAELEAELSR